MYLDVDHLTALGADKDTVGILRPVNLNERPVILSLPKDLSLIVDRVLYFFEARDRCVDTESGIYTVPSALADS